MNGKRSEVPTDALSTSLEGLTGSRERAAVLTRYLQGVAESAEAPPELAEMARDLLAGRLNIHDITRSGVYRDALSQQIGRFVAWYRELGPEEREQLATKTRQGLESLDKKE